METQRKYKFKANIWIIGFYKGEQIIGRTFLLDGAKYITLITAEAKMTMVNFDDLRQIKKLTFPNFLPCITTEIQNKKRKSRIEKHILETLTLINKPQ